MSRRTLAIVLTVLLTVSTLIALAPVQAHSVSAPAQAASGSGEASQPAADIAFEILNGYGYPTTTFYPGEVGWGSLCFVVYDPVDHAVNVTITDPNAARDGVASPAFHYEATLNTTTSEFDSYTARVSYTFPASLPYGGQWTVNFSAPNGGTVLQGISVQVYSTELSSSVGDGATLPGEAVSLFWSANLNTNGATLYTRATNVTLRGHYTGNGTVQTIFPFPKGSIALTPASAGYGEWNGVVPANATPDTQMHFEVSVITNVSGQVVENESANITVSVGALTIRGYGITPAPPSCELVNDVLFATGSLIASCIEVGALYYDTFSPIAGLPVTVHYWNGTAHVTPSGGAPSALTTNASGEAAFTFLATSPPFITEAQYPVYDALNFTVSVPGASIHYRWTAWLNATWTLTGGTPASGLVQVSLDRTTYYAGAVATATWSLSSTNLSKTGKITAIGWIVTGPDAVTYAEGVLNNTMTSGTFTFSITEAMVPHTIEVLVYVANATRVFDGAAYASVLGPSLLLTPASEYYSAGSTTTVTALLNGGGAGATIQYEVMGYWTGTEALLSNGTVANDSNIPISVASTAPPVEIEVTAWATSGGQVIANSVVTILLAQGYSILLGVSTPSSYSDGSYQPGQTVTLTYQVVSTGGAALPQVVTFELLAEGYPYYALIHNVGPSGTISFTIPSDAVQGTLLLVLEATGALSAGTCFPAGSCTGVTSLYINPSPSAFNYELVAGSGFTVGWLILLILVVIVAVVLVLMMRRRGGRRPAATSSAEGTSTSGPAEWKGPTSEPAPQPPATGESSPPPQPELPTGPS